MNVSSTYAQPFSHLRQMRALKLEKPAAFLRSNEKYLVVAFKSGQLWSWEKSQEMLFAKTSLHSSCITSMALQDEVAFSGAVDKSVKAWDMQKNEEMISYQKQNGASVCLQIKEGRLLSGTNRGALYLWDAETGASILQQEGQKASIVQTEFLDGHTFFAGRKHGEVELWDARANACVFSIPGYIDDLKGFASFDAVVATIFVKGALRFWDVRKQIIDEYRLTGAISSFSCLQNNLVVGDSAGVCQFFKLRAVERFDMQTFANASITALHQIPQENVLVIGDEGGACSFYHQVWKKTYNYIKTHTTPITSLKVSDADIYTLSRDDVLRIFHF